MAPYFPQYTGTFKLEEPRAIQRFSRAIVPMAVVTGIGLRLLRSLALSLAPNATFVVVAALFALGVVILVGMTALHLGNYTLHRWAWRAPAFAALEAAAESLTSLALIAVRREPMGSSLATFADWPELVIRTFFWRLTFVILFALVLAGVVQLVRFLLLRREGREHTAKAVHDEIARQTAEHEKQV